MPRLNSIDPLLTVAKVLVTLGLIISAIATAAVLVAIPVILAQYSEVASALAAGSTNTPLWLALAGVACFLLLVACLAGAVFAFLRLLDRMIGSVAAGNPFTPANPQRLWRMAWIVLGLQFGWMLVEGQALWLGRVLPQGFGDANWHFQVHGSVTFPGVTLIFALVLFILARVFRQGAEMGEELDGVV